MRQKAISMKRMIKKWINEREVKDMVGGLAAVFFENQRMNMM